MAYDSATTEALGLGHPLPAPMSLVDQIADGLPVRVLESLSRRIAPRDAGFKYQLVAKATLARRKEARPPRLSADESERLVRLANVWGMAERVWGGAEAARRFMFEPHALLDGRSPLDLTVKSEMGARVVEDVLGGLAYGSAV